MVSGKKSKYNDMGKYGKLVNAFISNNPDYIIGMTNAEEKPIPDEFSEVRSNLLKLKMPDDTPIETFLEFVRDMVDVLRDDKEINVTYYNGRGRKTEGNNNFDLNNLYEMIRLMAIEALEKIEQIKQRSNAEEAAVNAEYQEKIKQRAKAAALSAAALAEQRKKEEANKKREKEKLQIEREFAREGIELDKLDLVTVTKYFVESKGRKNNITVKECRRLLLENYVISDEDITLTLGTMIEGDKVISGLMEIAKFKKMEGIFDKYNKRDEDDISSLRGIIGQLFRQR